MLDPILTVAITYILIRSIVFLVGWIFSISIALFLIYILLFKMDEYQEKVFDTTIEHE